METDWSVLLPDDVLADVLGRLAPRDLALSRTVCKLWHAVIDAHGLLQTKLLPLSLGGIFINYHNYSITEFFSRPSSRISGVEESIIDHCNGLLLVYDDYVAGHYVVSVLNPATGWHASLPPCPRPHLELDAFADEYLAYDPAVSPHYEVFVIPRFHSKRKPGDFHYDSIRDKVDLFIEQSEWPPIKCTLDVFSSVSGQWEERPFVREGEAAAIIADMRHWAGEQRNAVYWRGVLYVHCQTDFVMR